MITGRDTLQEINSHVLQVQSRIDDADREMDNLNAQLNRLRIETAEQYRQLAKFRLDEIRAGNDGLPRYTSNHAGGVLGGISTGQDIIVRFAVKPTSSILTPRATIDRFGQETDIRTKGRHDPCVGIRAVPVGEAMMALVLADHLLRHRAQTGRDGPIALT